MFGEIQVENLRNDFIQDSSLHCDMSILYENMNFCKENLPQLLVYDKQRLNEEGMELLETFLLNVCILMCFHITVCNAFCKYKLIFFFFDLVVLVHFSLENLYYTNILLVHSINDRVIRTLERHSCEGIYCIVDGDHAHV